MRGGEGREKTEVFRRQQREAVKRAQVFKERMEKSEVLKDVRA